MAELPGAFPADADWLPRCSGSVVRWKLHRTANRLPSRIGIPRRFDSVGGISPYGDDT